MTPVQKPTNKPPRPPDAERIWWRYWKTSRWRWFGSLGIGSGIFDGGYGAFTERGLRRKLARKVWKIRKRRYRYFTTKVQR